MSSGFTDPNNHVPDVSPGDEWDDSGSTSAEPGQGAVLPPRRTALEKPAAESPREAAVKVEAKENSFHIEPRLFRSSAVNDEPVRLQVQEITADVVRLEQEVVGPPKVERLQKFHERPVRDESERKTRGENREWGNTRLFLSWRWMLGIGLSIPLLIIGVFLLLPLVRQSGTADRSRLDSIPTMEAAPTGDDTDPLTRMLLKQPDAIRLYSEYVRAKTLKDLSPIVRDSAGLMPVLEKHWKPLDVPADWSPSAKSTWSVEKMSGLQCARLDGELPDHSRFSAYFILVEDSLQLDWKATTAYGTATFSELQKGNGDGREIRGVITPEGYYNATWPETDYQSYRLAASDREDPIWCYARRNSDANNAIVRALLGGDIVQDVLDARKVTVHLERGTGGGMANQWLIANVLYIDWVSP